MVLVIIRYFKPFITIMFHPVSSEFGNAELQIKNILSAINGTQLKKFSFGQIQMQVMKIYQEELENGEKRKEIKIQGI